MVNRYLLNLVCLMSCVRIIITSFVLAMPIDVFASIGMNNNDTSAWTGENAPLSNNNEQKKKKKGFFEQRYRGWLWFEDKKKEEKKPSKKIQDEITPEEARRETEQLKKQLDDLRDVMIARPTPEHVKNYIAVEEKMWARALALDGAQRQAKFLYPQLFDKLKNPENVHAVKFNRKLEQEKVQSKVKLFASKYDLVFFSKGDCPYCKEFAPILKSFSEDYGFKTEEASIDGNLTGLFEGKTLPDLADKLGIKATPTVVIVSKDGKTAMELIRGYVTTSELEEYIELADQYLEERKIKLFRQNRMESK